MKWNSLQQTLIKVKEEKLYIWHNKYDTSSSEQLIVAAINS